MIYKDFQNKRLSALGLGLMRLPTVNSNDAEIDEAQTRQMVDYAIKHGVNYFDTAWGYHFGNSERVIGSILQNYDRDSFYLASKFPGYDLANMDKVESIFEEQLKKCRVDHFDFYLFHNVCEMNIDGYLNKEYGIFDYLLKQKQNGRIAHLGFSVHGDIDTMKRFLEAYGEHMEFCQIQLNWLDWEFQSARLKVELLQQYNIPIWVMEPLRGGKLCRLDEQSESVLKQLRYDESIPGWSFRYLQSLPVAVTLSGMSDMRQLAENIEIFGEERPLNEQETAVLYDIAERMTAAKSVPCTACRYCTSHCPQQLDIPMLLGLYNEHNFTGGGFRAPMSLMAVEREKHPDACIGCRSCEAVCPQQIKISEVLADFADMLKG